MPQQPDQNNGWTSEEAYQKTSEERKEELMERDEKVSRVILETLRGEGYEKSPRKLLDQTIKKGYGMTEQEKENRIQNANKLVSSFEKEGFDFVTGVPDGTLQYIIESLRQSEQMKHQQAARESEAVGIAAGSALAGKKPIIYMQNSGLLDSINDLTSLLIEYELPATLVVGFRGAPGEDAPHHFTNGKVTIDILKKINVYPQILAKDNLEKVVSNASQWMDEEKRPAAILVIRGALK